MADKLKIFVSAHKQAFDVYEPPTGMWQNIDAGIQTKHSHWLKSKLMTKLIYITLSTTILATTVYFMANKNRKENPITYTNTTQQTSYDTVKPQNAAIIPAEEPKPIVKTDNIITVKPTGVLPIVKADGIQSPVPVSNNNVLVDVQPATNLPIPNTPAPLAPLKPLITKHYPTNPAVLATCKFWTNATYCSIPDSFKMPASIQTNGMIDFIGCDDVALRNELYPVWVTLKVTENTEFNLKNNFKNIKLVKPDGKESQPKIISSFGMKPGYMSTCKGKKFQLFFDDRMDLILLFADAQIGDRIIIDGLIEAEIK